MYGPVDVTFPLLQQLHVQEIRLNLYWGGKYGVAKTRPARATDPDDPAYDWALYDRTVEYAADNGIHVLFSIFGTPAWANGGHAATVAPTRIVPLDYVRADSEQPGRLLRTHRDGQRGLAPPKAVTMASAISCSWSGSTTIAFCLVMSTKVDITMTRR